MHNFKKKKKAKAGVKLFREHICRLTGFKVSYSSGALWGGKETVKRRGKQHKNTDYGAGRKPNRGRL